ncbi:calcium activated cation channel [Daedaleopsis nitida]|nr:calcium activated cation channel [Daedaleopsis nitida]
MSAPPSVEDQISTLSVESLDPSPDTITSLVRRVKIMTLKLLPIEVPEESISDPTSRVITPQVINAYIAAAGDFTESLPYCLLRARKEFMWDAEHNPADYGENRGRAIACEVLARRALHQAPPEQVQSILSARFRHKEIDGDISGRSSALEMAIDTHCTIFLSSSEAQDVVQDLWCGRTIQIYDDDGDVNFISYEQVEAHGLWGRLNPGRLGVPRYQNIFRILMWFLLLLAYSQAVREPLDKLDPNHSDLDEWEVVMYILALAFSFEDLHKVFKLVTLVSWKTFGFWIVISLIADGLLTAAFVLRIAGIASSGYQATDLRVRSFQCLSFAAPLLWMKLIPVFDGYKFIGTMQICVARMLKESGFFFCLLALLGVGFLQGLYALDAADGQSEHPSKLLHVLIQALLQSPNYEMFNPSPAGMILYYMWNVATVVILLNVLISLFSSAYEDVVEDAAAEYLTYFAGKVVGMIRAPDEFIYPPPFNLLEIFLVGPFEFFVSDERYATLNRYVMRIVFFVPLCIIALYETQLDPAKNKWVKDWFSSADDGGENAPHYQNPEVNGEDAQRGFAISKVPFEDLVAMFPDTTHSSEMVIMKEVKELRSEVAELKQLIKDLAVGKAKTE